jgi:hypothetical protein
VAAIESFFNEGLFSILKQASGDGYFGCVEKYFLTGVLPAFRAGMSPLTAATMISAHPQFHGIGGMTGDQVKIFAQNYLGLNTSHSIEDCCWVMQKYYNGYYFASGSNKELDRLYNPQFVYHYLNTLKAGGVVTDPEQSPAVHTTNMLKSIADFGQFSMGNILQLVAAGSQKTKIRDEFGFVDLMNLSGKDSVLTISLLVYLGVLTRDVRPGIVRIPNEVMKCSVSRSPYNELKTMLTGYHPGFEPYYGIYPRAETSGA